MFQPTTTKFMDNRNSDSWFHVRATVQNPSLHVPEALQQQLHTLCQRTSSLWARAQPSGPKLVRKRQCSSKTKEQNKAERFRKAAKRDHKKREYNERERAVFDNLGSREEKTAFRR